jgi:hypothetical protein
LAYLANTFLLFSNFDKNNKISQQPFEIGNLGTALLGIGFSLLDFFSFGRDLFFGSVGKKRKNSADEEDQSKEKMELITLLVFKIDK